MTWKRSSAGTSMVSTSARCTASPSARLCAALRPFRIEMRTRGKAYLLLADRFDVVAVRIDEERGEVAGAVVGAQPGLAVVLAAGLEPGGMEALDRFAVLRAEGDVRAARRLLLLVKPQ